MFVAKTLSSPVMTRESHGLVIRAQSRSFTVQAEDGEHIALVPKRLRYHSPDVVDPVAVGDRVRFTATDSETVIEEVLPRRNVLSRPASGRQGKRQLLASNLDVAVVVMAAAEPEWKPSTVDRYVVLASSAGIPAMVCMNKVDLDSMVGADPILRGYRDLGISVIWVSAETGLGLDALSDSLAGKTGVLIGPSGAGKSSLLNRLVPGAELRVGEVSERTQKGRHTTTWVEMLDLPNGGRLVDSPGIRVLDLSGVAPEDLIQHFQEMAPLTGECRFQDCRHLAEPDCGVKLALEEGRIAAHRYDSYRRIHESLKEGKG
jgi:ribosome biogenesis GTPase